MNNPRWRNIFVYVLILVAIGAILYSYRTQTSQVDTVTISDVAQAINHGQVAKVSVSGDDMLVTYSDKREARSRKEPGSTAAEQLVALGATPDNLSQVEWIVERPSDWGNIIALLGYTLPAIFVVGIIYFMLRQAQGTNNQAMSFGKSRARMFTGDQPTVTFEDVAGSDEAKEELQEVVEFLKEPEKFISLGARIPKGVLLVGPPGTGKTLLAQGRRRRGGRAVLLASPAPSLSKCSSAWAPAACATCSTRPSATAPASCSWTRLTRWAAIAAPAWAASHDEREQTLNQILVEMDGFDTDTNVIVMAATNRPDILDPALLRPGRFDRRVVLDRPDMKGREAILKVHVRGKPLAADVDLDNAGEVHARLCRRRHRKPGQRGRHSGGPPQPQVHRPRRLRGGHRARHARPGAPQPHHPARRKRKSPPITRPATPSSCGLCPTATRCGR